MNGMPALFACHQTQRQKKAKKCVAKARKDAVWWSLPVRSSSCQQRPVLPNQEYRANESSYWNKAPVVAPPARAASASRVVEGSERRASRRMHVQQQEDRRVRAAGEAVKRYSGSSVVNQRRA